MTSTPALEPTTSPTAGQAPPNAGDTAKDERAMKAIIWTAVVCALVLAAIGFVGSYTAVRKLAEDKNFGSFSHAFPIGIDAGIIVFLALDLILCHKRMPLPPLRWVAWALTGATVFYNASSGDKPITQDLLAAAMHATIPILFIGSAEAARHYVARLAQITADKHIDNPPFIRWVVAPASTFYIWRRMRKWHIRHYEDAIRHQKEVKVYKARLRQEHGGIRKAPDEKRIVLTLAGYGMSIAEAIALPAEEKRKQSEAEAKLAAEARAEAEVEAEAKHQAELEAARTEAKRRTEIARAEAAEAEAKSRSEAAAETARLEVEAKRRAEAEAARLLVAETEAKLAAIARDEDFARSEAELKRRQHQAEVNRIAAEQQARDAEVQAAAARKAREDKARAEAQRLAAEAATRSETTSGSVSTSGDGTGSASGSGSAPRSIAPQRGKRQSEVEAVLARIVEAGDPKCVSLEDVMTEFDLKQTTAYDRLKTAQDLYAAGQDLKSKSA